MVVFIACCLPAKEEKHDEREMRCKKICLRARESAVFQFVRHHRDGATIPI